MVSVFFLFFSRRTESGQLLFSWTGRTLPTPSRAPIFGTFSREKKLHHQSGYTGHRFYLEEEAGPEMTFLTASTTHLNARPEFVAVTLATAAVHARAGSH